MELAAGYFSQARPTARLPSLAWQELYQPFEVSRC
jgi:hypothetical protein